MKKWKTWEKAQFTALTVVLVLDFSWLFYFILNYEQLSDFARFITLFSLMFIALPIAAMAVIVDNTGLIVWYLTGKDGDPPRLSLT